MIDKQNAMMSKSGSTAYDSTPTEIAARHTHVKTDFHDLELLLHVSRQLLLNLVEQRRAP